MTGIDTVSSQLSESLQQAGIDNLLEFLSKKPDDELRLKNQERGEPDLTSDEKLGILREHLNTNPGNFLSRFGHHLNYSHLDTFHFMRKKNYDVNFYLTQLEKQLSPDVKKIQAKNRRYEALQKLVDTSDYFTEEEMQRRDPILFEQLIGRFHTKEEREAFLQLSSKSSSSSGPRPTPLSDMLIAHMNRAPGEFSDRRIEQENQIHDEDLADHQYQNGGEEGDDEDDDVDMIDDSKDPSAEEIETEEIEDEEKEVLKEEFFTTMYRRFLNGMDEDFDYSTVDDNPEYDCGETLDQDAEDKYFEGDEDEDEQGQQMSDNCEVTLNGHGGNENGGDCGSGEVKVQGTHNIDDDDDEEDELDLYMKRIESEVSRQKQFS